MSSSLRTTLSRVCRRVAAELVVVSSYLIIVIACLFIYFFLARADYNLCPCLLLATGASPLGDMPHSVELASLGLPLTPGGEDPSLLLLAQLHRRAEETHASLYLLREQANLQATPETPPLLPHKRPDSV